MNRLCCVPFLGLTFLAATLAASRAQVVAPAQLVKPKPGQPLKEGVKPEGDKPADAPAAPADGKNTAEKKEDPRLVKFRQLTLDRRPSNILRVWNLVNSPPAVVADPKKETKTDPLDAEMDRLRQAVVLSQWDKVKTFLKSLPADDGKLAYTQFLNALQAPIPLVMPNPADAPTDPAEMMQLAMAQQQRQQVPPQFQEQNSFSVEDVLGIASTCPVPISDDHLKPLGRLLARALGDGRSVIEDTVARFQKLAALPAGQSPLDRRQFAKLLVAANQATSSEPFLPKPAEAKTAKDAEALSLWAQLYLARNLRDKKAIDLENAWNITQDTLALEGVKNELRDEAMRRAVELAPRVKDTLGQNWLEESFTRHIDRGREILAALGGRTSQGIQSQPGQTAGRLGELKLQKLAVEALLKAAPQRAAEWREQLTLLAGAWLKEGELSRQYDRSASLGPRMSFDQFGNVFYTNDDDDGPAMRFQQPISVQAIRVGDLLGAMPGDQWAKATEEGFQPKFSQGVARLLLKVREEEKAFPHIERLASSHPDKARQLVDEFLKVWARNHNLNNDRQTRNPMMIFYGFERRAEGIPLTRSKQERSLVELASWVARLRKLTVGEVNQDLLAKAFTGCHSSAEVYKLESIESVFGPLPQIKPRTLSGLVQQMRENLAGVWRDPAAQEDKKTNRKQKDIQQEVLRGYRLALQVTANARKAFPADWSLTLAMASLLHDEINYQSEIAKDPAFAARRDESMSLYGQAAAQYCAMAPGLAEDDQSLLPFEQWFHAGLGAVDVRFIDEEKLLDNRQPALVRQALATLPGELGKQHMNRFANSLFTRLSGVKPAAKFRYLKAGFDIVGDNKAAWEARKLYDYYKDLVSEVKLDLVLDGSSRVGHDGVFGAFVNLRHTREIERESGGFSRYLQNQNSGRGYSYNYGRPTTDYRDRFTESVREALKQQFEVISVTFQDEKVNSRATAEYGWRFTPYAYLLLKPKGPQVDRIPPVRLDMDFIDTSGYMVLPVSSPAVPIDATPAQGDPRPLGKTVITQVLDERQAAQGKLILEVKAAAVGLPGELDNLVNLAPPGFEVTSIQGQPAAVTRFDPEAVLAINGERSWTVQLAAQTGIKPEEFTFGSSKNPSFEMVYQRYADADLANATQTVQLESSYGKKSASPLLYALVGGGALLGLAGIGFTLLRGGKKAGTVTALTIPDNLDVFQLLALLGKARRGAGLSEAQRTELDQTVESLERGYFSAQTNTNDLQAIAHKWLRFAN